MPNTPDLGISHITAGQTGKEITANAAFDVLDIASNGSITVDCSAGGSIATSALAGDGYAIWQHWRQKLTGSPGGAFNYIVPLSNPKVYVIDNQSGQNATVKGATGTGVTVATSNVQIVYCDGTNVVAMTLSSSGIGGTVTMGGDVSGPSSAASVDKIKGISISATPPTTGQILVATSPTAAAWADEQSPTQTDLPGTTSGHAYYSTLHNSANYKKFMVFLSAYYNTSGTPQTITIAFSQTPAAVANTDPPVAVSNTTLTLPSSMAAPVTGFVIVEGF